MLSSQGLINFQFIKKQFFFNRLRKRNRCRKLFKFYNHSLFLRFQHNNFFLSTFNFETNTMFHQTVSKLIDYRKKKKKKKTYMAGYEYAYLMQPFFIKQGIQTFSLKVKGKGAQVRGFFEGLCRNDLLMIQTFYQRTYLAHNGTKTVRKRRL